MQDRLYQISLNRACLSNHGTIIQIGTTCKTIPLYMRDSACLWRINKKGKIF